MKSQVSLNSLIIKNTMKCKIRRSQITAARTWYLSAVNFVRRDSDKPCENGVISFEGVGDSCTREEKKKVHEEVQGVVWVKFNDKADYK